MPPALQQQLDSMQRGLLPAPAATSHADASASGSAASAALAGGEALAAVPAGDVEVSTKALSLPCVSTVFLSKTVPLRALRHVRRRRSGRKPTSWT
eukprot:SAG22_NODE_1052_length_5802_cov_1.994564_4_plen_96_part_00